MSAPTPGEALRNRWFKARYGNMPPRGSYALLAGGDRTAWEAIALPPLPEKRAEPRTVPRLLVTVNGEPVPETTGTPVLAPGPAAVVLAEVLDFLGSGIPPGDEFALQVARWRERGLPS